MYPVSLINRILPVVIVAFRYIYTCRSSLVQTKHQRSCFNFWLFGIILFVSTSLTIFSIIYIDKSYFFLKCEGKEELFHEEFKNFDIGIKLVWLLPIYHPFQLISIFAFFAFTFIVPAGYICIYRFRKQQVNSVRGLAEFNRVYRKKSNLVTTKYNLIIWIIEAVSMFSIMFSIQNNVSQIFYFSIPSTFSPILYFIGILENRERMRIRFQDIFMESKQTGNRGLERPSSLCLSTGSINHCSTELQV